MENGMGETHIDAFNSGCDLVLHHVETFINNLEASEDDVATKYDKLLRLIAGMRVSVSRRMPAKQEEPTIAVPDQQIIIPN